MATAQKPTPAEVEEIRRRLRDDGLYYAEHCLKIPDERGKVVPFVARKGQRKIEAAIQAQQALGDPIRIITLKSRRIGSSAWSVQSLVRRLTQRENRKGQIVAHDRDTAAELFDLANWMYSGLPDDPELKPPIYQHRNTKDSKLLWWGEKARYNRERGDFGINSQLTIDTAGVVEAGRGKTIFDLLCTEVAHWPDPRKALALLNAVFDLDDTLIILESTANGHNWFKDRWDRAMRGEGGYTPVFIGWLDDEKATKAFRSEEDREHFIQTIGTGEWGEDEPRLQEQHNATPEQLNWRRDTIVDKCEGKIELFNQEYPSDAALAFVGSGKHVFSVVFTQRAIDRAEQIETLEPKLGGPMTGVLKETETRTRRIHDGSIEVPTGALWVPQEATNFPVTFDFWRRWAPPDDEDERELEERLAKPPPRGQYIIDVDPASGDENTSGDSDYHAIQVIDHRTREQVARLETRRLDPDELAYQALLAALFYNDALINVETTGGYGVPITRKLWDAYGYRRLNKRKAVETPSAKTIDRLGWDTNRRTKPLMLAGFRELLREGTHGLRDIRTTLQITTYVVDEKGNEGADASAFDDLLTSFMRAQEVARETRLRPESGGSGVTSTFMRQPPNRRGW